MTTACLPANWLSEYSLPSEPFSLKSGALSPSLTTAVSSACAVARANRPAAARKWATFIGRLLDAVGTWNRDSIVEAAACVSKRFNALAKAFRPQVDGPIGRNASSRGDAANAASTSGHHTAIESGTHAMASTTRINTHT